MPVKKNRKRIRFIFNKSEANRNLLKIYRILSSPRTLVFLHHIDMKNCGECELGIVRRINLDPTKEIILTAIHECLHFIYLKARDPKIYRMEIAIFYHMSEIQIIHLLNRIANAVNRTSRIGKEIYK